MKCLTYNSVYNGISREWEYVWSIIDVDLEKVHYVDGWIWPNSYPYYGVTCEHECVFDMSLSKNPEWLSATLISNTEIIDSLRKFSLFLACDKSVSEIALKL